MQASLRVIAFRCFPFGIASSALLPSPFLAQSERSIALEASRIDDTSLKGAEYKWVAILWNA